MTNGIIHNLLFIWYGKIMPAKYLKNMERACEIYPEAKLKFVLDETIQNPQICSDRARVEYLSKNPYTLYLDCDAWCIKPIPTDKKGSAGIWALYNHNDLETFKTIVKNMPVYYGKMIRGNRLDEYFKHGRNNEI